MKYVYVRKSNFVAQLSQLFSQYNMHGVAMDSEEAMLDDILRELDRYEQDGE